MALLLSTWAFAEDVLIADAQPGRWVEGKGVLVSLGMPDGVAQYAVLAKGTNGAYAVFPAEVEVKVPEGTLGRVCRLVIMIRDDTPNDQAPPRLGMRVQGIKTLQGKKQSSNTASHGTALTRRP